jgi:predicted  nucleic acid-binding Zn-ribbon protein
MTTCCPSCGNIFKHKTIYDPCPYCGRIMPYIPPLKIEDLNGDKREEIFHPKIDSEVH